MQLLDWLEGKKTYLVALVMAVLNLCVAAGWVDINHLNQINVILSALGLGALRAGVAKG